LKGIERERESELKGIERERERERESERKKIERMRIFLLQFLVKYPERRSGINRAKYSNR
jgi:hypothetical protein